MGEKEILKWLKDKKKGQHYERMLRFCSDAQTYDERKWEKELKMSLREMFDVIKNMKEAGGMEFVGDRKWKTTDAAKELLKEDS